MESKYCLYDQYTATHLLYSAPVAICVFTRFGICNRRAEHIDAVSLVRQLRGSRRGATPYRRNGVDAAGRRLMRRRCLQAYGYRRRAENVYGFRVAGSL